MVVLLFLETTKVPKKSSDWVGRVGFKTCWTRIGSDLRCSNIDWFRFPIELSPGLFRKPRRCLLKRHVTRMIAEKTIEVVDA